MPRLTLSVNKQVAVRVPHQYLEKVLKEATSLFANRLKTMGPAEISLAFVSNQTIAKLNKQYRGVKGPTDVLSFPLAGQKVPRPARTTAKDGPNVLGEIVIAPGFVKKEEMGLDCNRKALSLVFLHGLLHLLGFEHKKSKKENLAMVAAEKKIIARIPQLASATKGMGLLEMSS